MCPQCIVKWNISVLHPSLMTSSQISLSKVLILWFVWVMGHNIWPNIWKKHIPKRREWLNYITKVWLRWNFPFYFDTYNYREYTYHIVSLCLCCGGTRKIQETVNKEKSVLSLAYPCIHTLSAACTLRHRWHLSLLQDAHQHFGNGS